MEFSDMVDEVMQEIKMRGTTEEALVKRWINQGVLKTVTLTLCEIEEADVDLDVGQGEYEGDEDILSLIDLWNTTDNISLQRITWAEMSRYRSQGSTSSSGLVRYYAAKADTYRFYPVPAAATVIHLFYVPKPRTLVEDTDVPSSIPLEWHELPVWWAMFRASSRDDDQSGQNGERYRNYFTDGITQMKRALKRKGGLRSAPQSPNWRGMRTASNDNSRYP